MSSDQTHGLLNVCMLRRVESLHRHGSHRIVLLILGRVHSLNVVSDLIRIRLLRIHTHVELDTGLTTIT